MRLVILFSVLASSVFAREPREIRVLELEGAINPITSRYLARELESAAAAGLIVIRLDTPGGLESSMREMSQAILASPVPVVVYVAPSGARAASAGMFLTISAHVAAMAPGTNIGAAHPVGLGANADQVMTDKVTEDAAALARSIAQTRGRNAQWAERSVRQSAAISAQEALEEGVIDLVAADLPTLLQRLDGSAVSTAGGAHVIEATGAPVEHRRMSTPERILLTLTDPNVAYLLLTLGLLGLSVELLSPGLFFPGIAGLVSLLLAFVALGSLPLNWAGLALMVVAAALVAAETQAPGVGALGAGGLLSFILGSLLLYRPSVTMPDVRVSAWLIALMGVLLAALLVFLVRVVVRSRRMAVITGIEGLVGATGVATSELSPQGLVELNRESWQALAVGEPIHRGDPVRVTGVEGVTLHVTRQPPQARP